MWSGHSCPLALAESGQEYLLRIGTLGRNNYRRARENCEGHP